MSQRDSVEWLLRMVAMLPECSLTSLIADPYGVIGDALESIGQPRTPDSWTALQRFAGLGDPGEFREPADGGCMLCGRCVTTTKEAEEPTND